MSDTNTPPPDGPWNRPYGEYPTRLELWQLWCAALERGGGPLPPEAAAALVHWTDEKGAVDWLRARARIRSRKPVPWPPSPAFDIAAVFDLIGDAWMDEGELLAALRGTESGRALLPRRAPASTSWVRRRLVEELRGHAVHVAILRALDYREREDDPIEMCVRLRKLRATTINGRILIRAFPPTARWRLQSRLKGTGLIPTTRLRTLNIEEVDTVDPGIAALRAVGEMVVQRRPRGDLAGLRDVAERDLFHTGRWCGVWLRRSGARAGKATIQRIAARRRRALLCPAAVDADQLLHEGVYLKLPRWRRHDEQAR